jgi:hypothetical protein
MQLLLEHSLIRVKFVCRPNVLVQDKIADQFIEKLIEKTRSIRAGNPTSKDNVLGVLESRRCKPYSAFARRCPKQRG